MHKLLLVEDNATEAELFSEALKELLLPIELHVVSDGESAIETIFGMDPGPDLVLLDINLPKMSGLEVLREIRSDHEFALLPVIILTNSNSDADVRNCYEARCNAYVQKPMGIDALMDLMRVLSRFWLELVTLPTPTGQTPSEPVP